MGVNNRWLNKYYGYKKAYLALLSVKATFLHTAKLTSPHL